jgi:hypothetical protein
MSNFQDCVVYLAGLGDRCPTAVALKAALSSGVSYAKNGDSPWPGVTFVDVDNGLVHIDILDTEAPGLTFCAYPALVSLNPMGQGYATVEWNSASAKLSDNGFGMWAGVMPMVKQDSVVRPWAPNNKADWIPNARSVGSEFASWPVVIEHLLKAYSVSAQ